MGDVENQAKLNKIDNTLDAYRKWFDTNQMDFNIECRDNKYSCSAWFRGKWGGAQGFPYEDLMKAVHSCYEEAQKEIPTPSARGMRWFPS